MQCRTGCQDRFCTSSAWT